MTNCILIIGGIVAVAGGFLIAAALLLVAGYLLRKAAYFAWVPVKRIYHWNVMRYWLQRLEKEGTHCFQKADEVTDDH